VAGYRPVVLVFLVLVGIAYHRPGIDRLFLFAQYFLFLDGDLGRWGDDRLWPVHPLQVVIMAELNKIIHQPVRLRIMAALVTLEPIEEVDFTYLQDLLEVTPGNLGAHLRKLEEAKYITIKKTFVNRKPRSFISATPEGRKVFDQHVKALEDILKKK